MFSKVKFGQVLGLVLSKMPKVYHGYLMKVLGHHCSVKIHSVT